jgi:hypothetical protein
MVQETKQSVSKTEKSSWEPMRLSTLGKATSLIQGGGGKVSLVGGDPGENKKQKNGG